MQAVIDHGVGQLHQEGGEGDRQEEGGEDERLLQDTHVLNHHQAKKTVTKSHPVSL